MKQTLSICATALFASISVSNAAVVDTFDIQTSNPNGADSSFSFVLGTEYTIEVSGTFLIAPGRTADAEYFDIQTGAPRDLSGTGFDIGVQLNDADIDWGPFQNSNIYSFVTDALDGVINLRLAEAVLGAYNDNVGALSVSISDNTTVTPPTVPLPAGMPLLLAGLGALAWVRSRK